MLVCELFKPDLAFVFCRRLRSECEFLTFSSAGASRAAVQRASAALLHKDELQHKPSNAANSKSGSADEAAAATGEASASASARKSTGAAAESSARPRSSTGMRPIVGFEHYRSSMDTVEGIERKSSCGIARDKYVETLIGCIDARHAAKTEPKLLSRSVLFVACVCLSCANSHTSRGSYLNRFIEDELKYEETRRIQGSNLDYLIQARSFGRESSVAIDSSGKRVEYPQRLRSAAAADDNLRQKAIAASRLPLHDRLPFATPSLPKKQMSARRIDFKRSA
jgi:hypothetical protein